MSWIKWPLLFFVVYGALWVRKEIRGSQNEVTAYNAKNARLGLPEKIENDSDSLLKKTQKEDPKSEKSLSYAFEKLSPKKAVREVSSLEQAPETIYESNLDLQRVLSLKDQPAALIVEADAQLARLNREELPERVILLREVIGARNADTMYQVEEVFERERAWLIQESQRIRDNDALGGYIGELTRLCLMADAGKGNRQSMLQELTDAVSHNPYVLKSLKTSIKSYIPWEYNNWNQQFEGSPQ